MNVLKRIKECEEIDEKDYEEFFGLYNKVYDEAEWYLHSKGRRNIVLEGLKKWVSRLDGIAAGNYRAMEMSDKILLLKSNNILFPINKEVTYGCSACRSRMVNRIKLLLK
jgi:hypothetical protein